jgi:GxxExxY protein
MLRSVATSSPHGPAAPSTPTPHWLLPDFSQRDQEFRSFWGFRPRSRARRATQSRYSRLGLMIPNFDLSERVLGACIEVHRLLGPGLLESVYEECLCHELSIRGLSFERQMQLPIEYKGTLLAQTYRADLIVERSLLVEVKSVESLLDIHAAQVITYLRIGDLPSGLLVNFNAMTIRSGLRRLWRTPKTS